MEEQRPLSIRLVRERCLSAEQQQQLSPEEIADLLLEHSALDLHHAGITDISEVYAFSHIQSLSLSHNCIRDMRPLAALTGCKVIRLSHNRIDQIDGVEMLMKLIELDVQHNLIRFTREEGFKLPPQLRRLCVMGNPLFARSSSNNSNNNRGDGDDACIDEAAVRSLIYERQLAEMEQLLRVCSPNIHVDVCELARAELRPSSSKERIMKQSILAMVSQLPKPPPTENDAASEEGAAEDSNSDNTAAAAELERCKREMDRIGNEELRVFRERRRQSKQAEQATISTAEASSAKIMKAREYLEQRREQLRREIQEYEQATRERVESLRQQHAQSRQSNEIPSGENITDSTHVQENTPR